MAHFKIYAAIPSQALRKTAKIECLIFENKVECSPGMSIRAPQCSLQCEPLSREIFHCGVRWNSLSCDPAAGPSNFRVSFSN
jgi:hypothetical protein